MAEGNLLGWGPKCKEFVTGSTSDQWEGCEFREVLVYGFVECDSTAFNKLQGGDIGDEFPG